MNKWWADEDLLQLLLNLHINETFETAQLIGKRGELGVWQRLLSGLFWGALDCRGGWVGEWGGGVVTFTTRGCRLVPTEFSVKHGITVRTVLLWPTVDHHNRPGAAVFLRWAPAEEQCDGVLKWAEF